MHILGRLQETWLRYLQKRAERAALQVLIGRRDFRLLRDAGLTLIDSDDPHCAPLPQTKERRWSAPLVRLPPPSPRKRAEGDVASVSSSTRPAA